MVKLKIDPGHGGKDPGGGTNKHFKEKDMVLKISKYQLGRFKELGINVSLTRSTDKYIDSTPRANIVKNSGADYCISNHINAGGGNGAETIYSIHSDGKLATRILDELKARGQRIRRAYTKKNDSGNDWYFMQRQTGSVETVIVEYGFADTKEDSDRIIKNWKEYAEAVVKAFCDHVGVKYTGAGTIEPPKKETGSATVNKPSKPNVKPSQSKKTSGTLDIDGFRGPDTNRDLQRYFETPVDGIISRPSTVIKALQKFLNSVGANLKVDGYFGTLTIKTLQHYFKTPEDGKLSKPSLVIKELQRRLNKGKL